MTRAKRSLVSEALAAEDIDVITPSRDSAITLDNIVEMPAKQETTTRRAGGVRHGYRTSLYLPRDAQYKIREIALMKRCKPHDVLIEAMAEMFEKYNATELATQIRKSRDNVTT